MALEPGQVLDGKYRIIRMIGEGGMGAVFEGANTFINRRVAIKVLHAAAAGNEGVIKRFEREAQAAGTIGSDHILEVLDLGTLPGGDRYMVMEFLDGEELSTRIERLHKLTPRQLAPLIRQTLMGLKAAHAAQIVHRDLKPDNIFVLKEKAGQPDFVKIIDFGISKFNALSGDMSMTTTGAVMGTPFYMSPEQAKGSSGVDARTDLYAVGVIMYEALTGRVPFEGTSFNDLMFKIVLSDAPSLPEDIPADFRAIVRKGMARDAAERYQTADEFIAAIDQWLVSEGLRDSQTSGAVGFDQTSPAGLAGAGRRATLAAAEATFGQAKPAQAVLGQGGAVAVQTDGNWEAEAGAATQRAGADALPTKKFPVKAAGGALAALLVAAGAVFALGGEPASDAAAGEALTDAAAEPAKAEPEANVAAESEKQAAEKAAAEKAAAEKAAAEQAAKAAADAAAKAAAEKVAAEEAAKAAAAAKPATQPSTTARPTATKPATTKPATTSKPATTTKPATTKPTTTKPPSRDFGY